MSEAGARVGLNPLLGRRRAALGEGGPSLAAPLCHERPPAPAAPGGCEVGRGLGPGRALARQREMGSESCEEFLGARRGMDSRCSPGASPRAAERNSISGDAALPASVRAVWW